MKFCPRCKLIWYNIPDYAYTIDKLCPNCLVKYQSDFSMRKEGMPGQYCRNCGFPIYTDDTLNGWRHKHYNPGCKEAIG